MHTALHDELYRSEAADRVRRARRHESPGRPSHPPPWREHTARAVARLASRLDAESARKAVV
jgi:hypothetical protein